MTESMYRVPGEVDARLEKEVESVFAGFENVEDSYEAIKLIETDIEQMRELYLRSNGNVSSSNE